MDSKGSVMILVFILLIIAMVVVAILLFMQEPEEPSGFKCQDGSTVDDPPLCEPGPRYADICKTDADCAVDGNLCCMKGTEICRVPKESEDYEGCVPEVECKCVYGVCDYQEKYGTCAECSPEPKDCPDGSQVYRQLPDCEFEECAVEGCLQDSECELDDDNNCCLSGQECENAVEPDCLPGSVPDLRCVCGEGRGCAIISQCTPTGGGVTDPLAGTKCEGKTDLDQKGECLTSLAKEELDSKWCQFINKEHWRESCYYGVGKLTKDPADCAGPYYVSDRCFDYLFNGYIDDPAECLGISGRGLPYMDECIILGAMNTSDSSYCDEVSDLEKEKECINRVAYHNADASVCLDLVDYDPDSKSDVDSTLAGECIATTVLQGRFDDDDCDEQLDEINYNSVCLAVRKDSSYCDQITSVRLRNWCQDNT